MRPHPIAALVLVLSTALTASCRHVTDTPAAGAMPSDGPVVAVASGRLRGVDDGRVTSFKGIPFATPPVGELRWRAPQPAPVWDGVRVADRFKPDCAQLPFPGDAAPLGAAPAEDCLGLNVWRPSAAAKAPLPVLVWIYGGGFVNGGASPQVYDARAFAQRGLVFVSFNYRLGRFGFFAHPALSRDAAANGEPLGNYGLMDQLAALRWVRDNIAAFGGDPDNVTVFGESAGGGSVMQLLASPAAAGLFHRASVLSGGGRGALMGELRPIDRPGASGRPSAEAVGLAFAARHRIHGDGADALAALRALPAEAVIDGLNMGTLGAAAATYVGGPVLDGRIVLGTPQQALERGDWHRMPLLVGATDADLGFDTSPSKDALFAAFGPLAERARRAYDPDGRAELAALRWQVGRDRMMIEPARYVARQATAQGLPAYAYRFSYVARSQRAASPQGAGHASELPFVFDTVQARYGDALTADDRATAEAANRYWANFARTGDPNGDGLPAWPVYDPAQDVLLDFTPNGPRARPDPWKARLDLIEATLSRRDR